MVALDTNILIYSCDNSEAAWQNCAPQTMRHIVLAFVAVFTVAAGLAAQTGVRGVQLSQAAQPEQRRVALVIGNDGYANVAKLHNARNDARSMAAVLQTLGFATKLIEDGNRSTMVSAIAEYINGLRPSDIAFFYFSGHGAQIDGDNFLIPTDFSADSATATRLSAVNATDLQAAFGKARVSLMILDACRTNPFLTARGIGGGLAPMEARGTLIAFATGAGQTASDGTGVNGLFTQELLKELASPNQTLRDVFYHVRQRVFAASDGRQFPAVYDGLLGDVVLASASAPPPPVPAPIVSPLPSPVPSPTATVPVSVAATPHPPFTSMPATAIRTSTHVQWVDSAFVQSVDERVYLPFRLKIAPTFATGRTIAMFVRAVAASQPQLVARGDWESLEFRAVSDLKMNGMYLEAAMALRPGQYRVYIALLPVDGVAADYEQRPDAVATKNLTNDLKSRVDFIAVGGRPAATWAGIAESLEIPVLRTGRLSASSVILASAINQLSSLPTAERQRSHPYSFGTMEIVPSVERVFSSSAELAPVFWVYNAAADSAGKPDITADYAVFRVSNTGRTFVNRTAPQHTNAETLPAEYVASATRPLVQGLMVPVRSLSPGRYELEIAVRDNHSGDAIVQIVLFSVVP